MSSLQIPQWIDWTSTYNGSPGSYPLSTGYRKITNLLGGDPTSNNMEWLSSFHTIEGSSENTSYAPIWSTNPKYVWYLDQANEKLKVSDINDPDSYTINPVQNCKSSKSGYGNCKDNCCDTSSTIDDCLFSWNNVHASCGKNSYFNKDNETCDRWTYLSNSTPITDDECKGQDKVGTFCLDIQNKNVRMRSYLGCDLMPNSENTANISSGGNCSDGNVDDSNFCSTSNPEYARAEWKFIDDVATVACCSLPADQISGYEQCQYAFDPSSTSNKCIPVMDEFCSGNWGASSTIGETCNNFLGNSPMNKQVTQVTLQNYITSRSPQDYISRPLANNGNALSLDYYNSNNCSLDSKPDNCDTKPNQPCCRDDSDNPDNFFSYTVPYMCNYYYGSEAGSNKNNMQGACEQQLQYFCQEFSRDDLAADITLQNICGCFLLTEGPVDAPYVKGANDQYMTMTASPQDESPYYEGTADPAGAQCDVLCDTSQIQSVTLGGKCQQPVCMIDNVTINQVNSNSGSINFDQTCGGGTCYISNVSINEAGSNTTGAITLSQDCGTCYTFDGNNLDTATQVYCNTLEPISDSPPDNENKGIGSWFSDNKLYIAFFILIFAVLAFILFSFIKHHGDKNNGTSSNSIILNEDYWSSV